MQFHDFLALRQAFEAKYDGKKFIHNVELLALIKRVRHPESLRDLQLFLRPKENPSKGQRETVRFLRTVSVYPRHMSPLHECIRSNLILELAVLLEAGAKVEVLEEGSPRTPIEMAVEKEHNTQVSLLLAFGAKLREELPTFMSEKTASLKDVFLHFWRSQSETICESLKLRYNPSVSLDEEYLQGDRIMKEIKKVHKAIENVNVTEGRWDSRVLELCWTLERLESSPDYRTEERLDILSQKLTNQRKTNPSVVMDNVRDTVRCPVCMELPSGHVFSCRTCYNLTCKSCLEKLCQLQEAKTCPNCRQDLVQKPMTRNIMVERVIEALSVGSKI